MSYELTEEQEMLKETIARMAREQIAPGAAQRDEKAEFPWDMVELLRENALFGADYPEAFGGSEMGLFSLCLIIEEIAKACASTSVILLVHELGTTPIMLAGKRRTEKAIFSQTGHRRTSGCLRAHRTQRRFRCIRAQDQSRSGR